MDINMIFYLVTGIIAGLLIGWLFAGSKMASVFRREREGAQEKYNSLDKEFGQYRSANEVHIQNLAEESGRKDQMVQELKDKVDEVNDNNTDLEKSLSEISARLNVKAEMLAEKEEAIKSLRNELQTGKEALGKKTEELATAVAGNRALNDKLQEQKKEIEDIGKKFNMEFENIANKIMDNNSARFSDLSKEHLKTILDPLGRNIKDFKEEVQKAYGMEAKERFSLGEKVKELAKLNQQISEDAKNLTRALKSESKTRGRWGEMILESILEKTGLQKGREYFMEYQLTDENGNPLKSESGGRKMRPDALVKYPDNRHVIIDSKVSLNAFIRSLEADNEEERQRHLKEHVESVKKHIVELSEKGYDDYNKALDFVMMFVPGEPAYIAAMQTDPDLWNFAYNKRILLLSPANLITSLKLIADLWKREHQNQNALKIAERGARMYDKLVDFVTDLEDVGKAIGKAQEKYDNAYKRLKTGNDNLLVQATKMKSLGLKTKKELNAGFEADALIIGRDAETDES